MRCLLGLEEHLALKKEEMKVEIKDKNVLCISGERNRESKDRTDICHGMERSNGRFERRFRSPKNAKVNHVKAAMENDVFTITVPKDKPNKKTDVKSIQISG